MNHKFKKRRLEFVVKAMQQEIRTNINCLNSGGCAIFAMLFLHQAQKKYPSLKVACFTHSRRLIRENKRTVKRYSCGVLDSDYALRDLSVSHVALQCYGIVFDGEAIINGFTHDGVFHEEDGTPLRGYYTKLELETAVKHGAWNWRYDTSQNNELKKIIKKYVKQL